MGYYHLIIIQIIRYQITKEEWMSIILQLNLYKIFYLTTFSLKLSVQR